ncbi:DUF5133 domain-containing protein [Streptomyces sp. NPDC088762]|uniref:DUF5133 domain-containing protein n=1 Tax=Streptomyces sp. NPDC088762 TaxID=3365891 RepID=UPI0038118C1A
MTHSAAPHLHPAGADAAPATGPDQDTSGCATGIVMALVPCTAEAARRILANAARAAGVTLPRMTQTALALRSHCDAADPVLEQALRTAIGHAKTPPSPLGPATAGLLPSPPVLRRHLDHLRAARRRTLAAPEDPALRTELEDAAYRLCVLMGQRSAHGAVLAAEEVVAAHRLPPSGTRETVRATAPGPG